MSAIEKASKEIGGQAEIARLFGIKGSHVWAWIHKRKQAPAKYIRAIAEASHGVVSVNDLLKDHESQSKQSDQAH